MYLVDTNVVSELRKTKPHGAVLAWFGGLPLGAARISAATLGEIQAGIEKTRRQDFGKAAELSAWADGIVASGEVLAADAETFRIWARLMTGRTEQLSLDAMIAATAIRHGLTVATRNTRDFEQFGVALFNPFA